MAKCSAIIPCRWTGLRADTCVESHHGHDCSIVISGQSSGRHYVSIENGRPNNLHARIVGTRDFGNVEFTSPHKVWWDKCVFVLANGGDTNIPSYGHPNCGVQSCSTSPTSEVIRATIYSTHNPRGFAKGYRLAGRGNPIIHMEVHIPSVLP